MLSLTADLLSSIPEFSTLWNIRRELIEDLAASRLSDYLTENYGQYGPVCV